MKRIASLLLALTVGLSAPVNASSPVRVIVAYPVGGGTDILARYFEKKLGEQIFIDNRAGASGMIGTDIAARSAPNGATLLLGHVTPNAVNVGAFLTPPTNVNWNLDPIVMVATAKALLVANVKFGPNTMSELMAYAKSNSITYASDGIGSVAHLLMSDLMSKYDTVHVPYKGGAPALQAVLANETQIAFSPEPVVRNWMNNERIKIIPTTTIDELWWGLFAPKGTPPEILDKWHAAFTEILKQPSTQEWMKSQGYNVRIMSRKQFGDFVLREQEKYKSLIQPHIK